jgi:outer membrane protein assembly factor BamB
MVNEHGKIQKNYYNRDVICEHFPFRDDPSQFVPISGNFHLASYDWIATWNNAETGADTPADVAIDSSNETVVVGTSYDPTGDQFIVKYNQSGDEIWNDTRDGGNTDLCRAVAIDGTTIFIANDYMNTSASRFECFLAKYDSAGNRLWNISWSKNGAFGSYPEDMTMDVAKEFYIVGEVVYFSGTFDYEYLILKLDSTGNEIWNVTFGEKNATHKYIVGVTVRGDSLYVVGQGYNKDALLAKFNATTGEQLWNTTWVDSTGSAYARDVITDVFGNIYTTGYYGELGPERQLFLRKYTPSKTLVWEKIYNDAAAFGMGVTLDGNDTIYVAGAIRTDMFTGPALLLKYASNGNLLGSGTWEGPVTGTNTAYGVAVDSSGNTYLVGQTPDATGSNTFLIKNLQLTSPSGGIPGFLFVFQFFALFALIFLYRSQKKRFS